MSPGGRGVLPLALASVGLTVVVDATIVRALLVPATMRLLGRWKLVGAGAPGEVLLESPLGTCDHSRRAEGGVSGPPRVAGASGH